MKRVGYPTEEDRRQYEKNIPIECLISFLSVVGVGLPIAFISFPCSCVGIILQCVDKTPIKYFIYIVFLKSAHGHGQCIIVGNSLTGLRHQYLNKSEMTAAGFFAVPLPLFGIGLYTHHTLSHKKFSRVDQTCNRYDWMTLIIGFYMCRPFIGRVHAFEIIEIVG